MERYSSDLLRDSSSSSKSAIDVNNGDSKIMGNTNYSIVEIENALSMQ
jgi:hypothetical protein